MELTKEQFEKLAEYLLESKIISKKSNTQPFVKAISDSYLSQLLDDMTYVRPDEFIASLPVWVTEDDVNYTN